MTTKRAHFSCRCRQHPLQQWDYGHLAKLQTSGDDAASECRQVILEGARDFLYRPVFAKTSRHSRHLPAADRKAVLKIPVAKWFGPFGIVENPDAVGIEKPCHAFGKTNAGNRSGNDNPVPTGEHSCDFVRVPLKKQIHGGILLAKSVSTLYQVRFFYKPCLVAARPRWG